MQTIQRRGFLTISSVLVALVGAIFCTPLFLQAEDLPSKLSDAEFWQLVSDFSEDGGYFRSDNFLSNEDLFQLVIPTLQQTTKSGGVYLGVGPEQNFTYIAALKPRIAFIFDIRRQNVLEHLIYKALFEMSSDRADFLSRLFSRKRPAGLDTKAGPDQLFGAYTGVEADRQLFNQNLQEIKDFLVKTNGFKPLDGDFEKIDYVYGAFYQAGPDLNYAFQSFNGGFNRMPTYADLMTASDGEGAKRSYLATEENFRLLQDMQKKNLIVPVVGDFGGQKAIRSVGRYLNEHEAVVSVFYLSNVEQYLFQQPLSWSNFYSNVATLPLDSTSTFIRSVSTSSSIGVVARLRPFAGRFVSVVSSMTEVVDAFKEGRIRYYDDVISMSSQ